MIGLVGANGAGKSTLLLHRWPETAPPTSRARSTLSPPDATVGYLTQEPERIAGETVLEIPRSRRTGVTAAEQEMNAAAEALGGGGGDDLYSPALERWLASAAPICPSAPRRSLRISGLGVPGSTRTMTALSGGQAARAGLASLLLSRYDVLLLDEPTNDLDLDGLERLERFVAEAARGASWWSATIESSWRAP